MNLVPKIRIEPLVNREFIYLDKTKSFAKIVDTGKPNVKYHPFITVSREPGSGGKLIAKRVAERLGYKFYDRELIDRLFQKSGDKKQYEALYDEKEVSAIDDFITTTIYPNLISQDHFVKELISYVNSLALKGNCVILGRGSNFFTDHKFGFHVRITSPFEFRVQRTMQYEHLNEKDARLRVRQVSQERKKYVEKYFSTHIDNSEFYDLVLNRAYYSLEDAVNIVLQAFKKKIKK